MQLMLLRHGIAEEKSPDGADASRRLTEEGVKKTRQCVRGLSAFAETPDVILTSPKRRAVQTAELAGEAFDRAAQELAILAEDRPHDIIEELARRKEASVMIVGHEPTFSRIVQLLCAADEQREFIDLKKAGCACVAFERSRGLLGHSILLWLATPAMLREMK